METFLPAVFLIVLGLNLFFVNKKNKAGSFVTKVLLCPILLLVFIVGKGRTDLFIILALIGCFFGDLFLEWTSKRIYFLIGLLSFLTGHVFYGIYFLKDAGWFHKTPLWFYLLLPCFAAYGILFLRKLSVKDNPLKAAVTVYCTILLAMSFSALVRAWRSPSGISWIAFVGTLLFVMSDSILAYSLFKQRMRYSSLLVMLTYGLAQLLMITGV